MKKKFAIIGCVLCLIILCIGLIGCGNTEYTVQFDSPNGIQKHTVKSGERLTLEDVSVFQKSGYTFKGLYDAEVGGTKYVSGTGLGETGIEGDINLYAQYTPDSITVNFIYPEGCTKGELTRSVNFDAVLDILPSSIEKPNYIFKGWFTEADCGGTKISESDGTLIVRGAVNSDYFKISEDKTINLFAGFEIVKYDVTFCYGVSYGNITHREVVNIPHGSLISEYQPSYISEGKAAKSWSTIPSDTEKRHIFTSSVTESISLYVAEWSNVIALDVQGGDRVPSGIFADEGEPVTLPVPTRKDYKFLGWYTANDELFTATAMPAESLKLKAKWSYKFYKLTYNVNGGKEGSKEIIVEIDKDYKLYTPVRSEYTFEGWFTAAEGGVKLTDGKGQSLTPWTGTNDVTVFAQWKVIEKLTVSMTRRNCARNNGFNYNSIESNEQWRSRHNGWSLGSLIMGSCLKTGDNYKIVDGQTLSLKYKMNYSGGSLPKIKSPNGYTPEKATLYSVDTSTVKDTNISGEVGYGAYYVNVTYTDNTTATSNARNLFNVSAGVEFDLLNGFAYVQVKPIAKIEVVIAYGIYTGAPGAFGIWWHEYTNWHNSVTINFVQ